MVNRKELAGVRVDNCTLQEALSKMDIYLNSEHMSTVEMIGMKTFIRACEDECVRQCLEELDMVLPVDKEILQDLGILSEEREQEVQDNVLFHEFIKRIIQDDRNLFLFTETVEQMEHLCGYLEDIYGEQLGVTGSYTLEECPGDIENVVNEINSVTPDVIISVLPTPQQEQFILDHRKMLNAKIWFGIGTENSLIMSNRGLGNLLKQLVVRRKMKDQIQSYEASEEEE